MQVNSNRIIYKRKSLDQSLTDIWTYPLTVVEAPMGYGKTTAVREFLKASDAQVLWQTLADTSASSFWRGFCRLLKQMDAPCAAMLTELGAPADSVFMDAALELIEDIEFPTKSCIVFDDYHLLSSPSIDQFIERLVKAALPNLHVIIVSRTMFGENTTELALKGFCHLVGKSSFEFTPDEIAAYYKLCGVRLTSSETTALYAYTEGWVSALYLSLLNFEREQKIDRQATLSELIEKNVYRQCPAAVKEFLLSVCIFDSFTLAQAQAMWPRGSAETLVRYLMNNNAFVKFNHYNQTYHIHNIFILYLREQLARQNKERQREIQLMAGVWHADSGDYVCAMECFYQAHAFDRLLFAFEKDNGHNTVAERKERIMQYFTDCPEQTRKQYPIACLIYTRKLFMLNEREQYAQACQKVGEYIDAVSDEKAKKHLQGELELTKSFSKYNDLQGMVEHQANAYALLDGPSRLFDHKNLFTFGTPSVLYMFYRQSGAAKQTANMLTEFMPRYGRMTAGHGAGAEYVMQAECHFNRGNFEDAAITIFKAEQPARANRQIAILLCVLFLQARLAFVNGDLPTVQKRLRQMREEVEACGQYQVVHTMDMCEGFIHAQLNQTEKIPLWIVDGKLQKSPLYFLSHAFFNIIYGKTMLLSGQYLKLLGLSSQFLDLAGRFPNLLSQIYIYIYEAAAYKHLQRHADARESLCQALALAAPDHFIMPFVENGEELLPLLNRLANETFYAGFIASIKKTYVDFAANLQAMQTASQNALTTSLTMREQEVAELVAAGMSNKAIAQKLFLAEATVKKTLQNVYAKLGISGRTMLTRLMLEAN